MAHINGWNDANQDYEAQLQSFETAAHALGGSLKVYVSYPNFMQGGAALQVLLAESKISHTDSTRGGRYPLYTLKS